MNELEKLVKAINTRLSRKGSRASREEIRNAIFQVNPNCEGELTDDEKSKVVEILTSGLTVVDAGVAENSIKQLNPTASNMVKVPDFSPVANTGKLTLTEAKSIVKAEIKTYGIEISKEELATIAQDIRQRQTSRHDALQMASQIIKSFVDSKQQAFVNEALAINNDLVEYINESEQLQSQVISEVMMNLAREVKSNSEKSKSDMASFVNSLQSIFAE